MVLLEVGRFASEALARGEGEVRAMFRRSLYLRVPTGRYVCIGDRSLGRGPLNALVSDWRPLASLAQGERFALSTAGAKLWRPATLERSVDAAQLALRVSLLARAATGRAPRDGLGRSIAGDSSPLIEYARPALASLERWLSGPRREAVPEQAQALIGLGPGLTPSGDDYLGGMLVALRLLGRRDFATALWRWLTGRLAGRTNEISVAHLEAAAAGEAHEALHACLHELLGAQAPRWKERLAQLDRVGHCSGWDAMAGAVAVARAAT